MGSAEFSWLSHVAAPMLVVRGDRVVASNDPAAGLFACPQTALPMTLDALFGADASAVRQLLRPPSPDADASPPPRDPPHILFAAPGPPRLLRLGVRCMAPALWALTFLDAPALPSAPDASPAADWIPLLPAILDRLPVALLIERDSDGYGVFVNSGFVSIFEYELADIADISDWWLKLYPDPDTREAARLDWEETLARSPPGDRTISASEFQVRAGSGVDRMVQFHSFRIGRYRVHSYVDVSERHQTTTDLRRLADTDALTGVANRRSFFHEAELLMATRPLSALLMDVDHFKLVNDRCGHAFGDRVLAEIAGRLKALLRPSDVLGRLGGEEFAVLLPGADPSAASLVAERLRAAIADAPVTGAGGEAAITVSIGVACITGDAPGAIDHLLAQADQALYAAKHAGRNRVCLAPPIET